MALQINVRGQRYDDSEPCFLMTQSEWLWNRVSHKWVLWPSLEQLAIDTGHTWSNRELGVPSVNWQQAHMHGHEWAPGIDDTAGLPSELIVNGEDWTGTANPATPPTSWTNPSGNIVFDLDSGVIEMMNDQASNGWISQTLTTVLGALYVFEMRMEAGTTAGTRVQLGGLNLPYSGGAGTVAFTFEALSSSTVLNIVVTPGGVAKIDYIRVYLASELTGSGIATVPPAPDPDPIHGPYMADDVKFWINGENCKVGFNIDSDPDADVWITGKQVCRRASISDQAKMGISAQLEAHGCEPLPCVAEMQAQQEAKQSGD